MFMVRVRVRVEVRVRVRVSVRVRARARARARVDGRRVGGHLSKARLARVSSRPVWSLLVRGSSPVWPTSLHLATALAAAIGTKRYSPG